MALVAAVGVVICILVTETRFEPRTDDVGRAQKGGLAAALTLVRREPSLRRIASLVSLAAIGSVLIDQQLNMAAEEFRGGSEDSVTSFLASVRFLLSAVSLVFQVFVVKRIYRLLGVGFAVLALPASLGITAVVILFTGVLLAPTVASVVDRSIRYTIDRTTREIFFLPLSGEICGARETLIGYGPAVVDVLEYFLADPEEDIWVRRHIPAILARIPCQRSIDILVDTLGVADSFLRFKAITAIQRIRREHPSLTFKREPIEDLLVKESRKYFNRLGLHHNLFVRAKLPKDSVLSQAVEEKIERTVDRIYRLLALVYPWKDIAAARWAIEHGDSKVRANALEYLDNVLSGQLRKRVMPVLDDLPLDEKVRRGNVILKTRPRDVEETLLELINDDDQVVAASAIALVGQR